MSNMAVNTEAANCARAAVTLAVLKAEARRNTRLFTRTLALQQKDVSRREKIERVRSMRRLNSHQSSAANSNAISNREFDRAASIAASAAHGQVTSSTNAFSPAIVAAFPVIPRGFESLAPHPLNTETDKEALRALIDAYLKRTNARIAGEVQY